MELQGSCACGKVCFTVQSRHPVPFMRCYCSICRKAGGSGGYGINTEADHATLSVTGQEHVKVFRAPVKKTDGRGKEPSPLERHFCAECGSHLWCWDPRWPDLCHPYASALDTPLEPPPSSAHIMLASKASWVVPEVGEDDDTFDEYPDYSLAEWHEDQGIEDE